MPMLIEHIDAITRQKQRDVLYIVFNENPTKKREEGEDWYAPDGYDYTNDPKRDALCQWLDEQKISWQLCGDIANENGWRSYRGQIYLVDVLFDESDPTYQIVQQHLEHPDGRMRDEHVQFCYMPLAMAMKNAHHDEPGFWEDWAESF